MLIINNFTYLLMAAPDSLKIRWVDDIIISVTTSITNSVLDFLMPFLSVGLRLNVDFWEVSYIVKALSYSCAVATGLLAIKVIKDLMVTYNLNMAGDPTSNPMNKIVKTGIAVIMIWAVPQVVKYAAYLGNTMVAEIGSLGASSSYEYALELSGAFQNAQVFKMMTTSTFAPGFKVILIIIVVINFIRICFMLIKRTIELLVMALIGPFFSISLAGDDYSLYGQWLKQLGLLIGSHIIQIILVRICLELTFRPASLLTASFFNNNGFAAYLFLFALTSFTVNIQGYVGKLLESTPSQSRVGQYAMTAVQGVRAISAIGGR